MFVICIFYLEWNNPDFKAYEVIALAHNIPPMACYYSYMKTISKQVNMTLFELPDSVRQTIIIKKSKCALNRNKVQKTTSKIVRRFGFIYVWCHEETLDDCIASKFQKVFQKCCKM